MKDTQIRVKTAVRYGRIYNDLKNLVIDDFHELFFVCACLGYKHKVATPLGKTGEQKIPSHTISTREWACYYAMLLEENDMDFLAIQDDKLVIARIEEYANAGMEILTEEFLGDYLISSAGQQQLDPGCSKELPKQFLHYIFEQIDIGIDNSSI